VILYNTYIKCHWELWAVLRRLGLEDPLSTGVQGQLGQHNKALSQKKKKLKDVSLGETDDGI
jgi:hypothetical protein